MMSSLVIPSAWAWKLVLMRWRRTGMAMRLTSSMATEEAAVHGARALPPLNEGSGRRGGPAPQSTSSCTNLGADSSLGRVARTRRATYFDDELANGDGITKLLQV